ncbi:PTS sugar transporter subunit IIB [Salipaludibacillus agaradhaerens]|uniref:PTS sugar transporter subunit IIB n=1 Tax=Salipaludibacillus agaradhaerens TaxID=76935 RepID=A0A9Q4B4T2_SALAG|nr:PTS sugar transporter subunit IIB [Salipaludibacillus agaradhaerens]MCR6097990.1 PTS sugar transporter subunit IIB [Salipaludibacillus agaradhaerens]MCR6105145.1 PTS sugar transporter subunit IIB [Salipaludibacillus agaradhaerens]MCR6116381.1 PTS sugar transporter subunit IIB [Salipaludibacillus agaradhaerens]MCR6117190.1 PTS sugar transporter subunit IIB [Salipaludibacillus agaradhaerens]
MNILLCCAAGMSTSLLVSRMEKAAKEQGKDYTIWAVPGEQARKQIDKADVLLLGPQVRFMLNDMADLGKSKGVPVDVINTLHYGTADGAEVLKHAESMAEK